MRCYCNLVRLITLVLLVVFAGNARAGTVNLWGIADGDSTYREEPSDAFIRVDLYDPPPRETQQRFHAISDPSITFGSTAYDGFPNDANWRLGSVTYDDAGLVGGTGVAAVTALNLGVGHDPNDDTYHNYFRWQPTNTFVDSFAGTVTLVGGQVTSIDLSASVHLEIMPLGPTIVSIPGTFSVSGNRFDGYMEVATGGENSSLIYDFAGTLTTVVPEPSTWLLAVTAVFGLAALRFAPGTSRLRR